MKEKLYIKDGSFYRGKEKVPPVFGDAEQIHLLKMEEIMVNELKEDGIPLGEDWMGVLDELTSYEFRCICKNMIICCDDLITCGRCRRNYKIEISEYFYSEVAKIRE
jgi:hypothetical protein